jgi:hypothetical protein
VMSDRALGVDSAYPALPDPFIRLSEV